MRSKRRGSGTFDCWLCSRPLHRRGVDGDMLTCPHCDEACRKGSTCADCQTGTERQRLGEPRT